MQKIRFTKFQEEGGPGELNHYEVTQYNKEERGSRVYSPGAQVAAMA